MLKGNVRYRFKKVKGGYQRLAFRGGKVIEVTKFKGKKGHLKKVAGSKKRLGR